jgi:hypothetical protein
MTFRIISIASLHILLSISAFSQEKFALIDTSKEVIIYEYDTVYLKPDTIRLTDTIVEFLKTKNNKNQRAHSRLLSRTLFSSNSFLSPLTPNYISFNAAPFISGNLQDKNLSDSLVNQTLINKRFSLLWNYLYRKSLFSVGIGFTPYHEKFTNNTSYYSSNAVEISAESYDSLLIKNEITYNYYYNYLNLYAQYGRVWALDDRLSLSFNIGCIADFLIAYKQGSTQTPGSLVRKFDASIIVTPNISYKLGYNFSVFIAPFYERSLLTDNKYPYTSFQKMGIGAGFNLFLK